MKKLSKKQLIKIINRLKPFWKRNGQLHSKFYKNKEKLEREMNNKIRIGTKLEFFYIDGECVGIGAVNYGDRKNFPLIHDGQLED